MEISLLEPWSAGLPVRIVGEPAMALSGATIWWTGNWYAALSTDSGRHWTYVDPSSDFATFSSDQDTVSDASRGMFLWYRQGHLVPGRDENSVKLSVSSNGAQSWCTYTFRPTDVDPSWTTLDFDYPRLALSRNYLYLTSTLLVTGNGFATPRMLLFRMPLDQLVARGAFSYVYWTTTEGWAWAPVENGAAEVMYLGDTLDPGGDAPKGKFRLYTQPEDSTDLTYTDHDVPAWTFTDYNGSCTVPGGGNPCARGDQRITSGWLRRDRGRGEIGFFWNVREGGGFPHPYVDAVTFDEETQTVTGRPFLWSPGCAWQYAAASPNDLQELGVAAFYFCDSQGPAHAVGIADAFTPAPPGWSMFYTRVSGVSTKTMIWGDYIRVRAASDHAFAATGYTLQPTGNQPHYTLFSRPSLGHLRRESTGRPPRNSGAEPQSARRSNCRRATDLIVA
jgi:hypothetical protein